MRFGGSVLKGAEGTWCEEISTTKPNSIIELGLVHISRSNVARAVAYDVGSRPDKAALALNAVVLWRGHATANMVLGHFPERKGSPELCRRDLGCRDESRQYQSTGGHKSLNTRHSLLLIPRY